MGLKPSSNAWPAIGKEQRTTYGGMSGSAVRPVALRNVSSIGNHIPGLAIMAAGGVESADTALQFLQCGASVVQVRTGCVCVLCLQARNKGKRWGDTIQLGGGSTTRTDVIIFITNF